MTIRTRSAINTDIADDLTANIGNTAGDITATMYRDLHDATVASAAHLSEVEHRVINQTTTAPPGSPSDRDTYIPAATATGAWAGQEENIAIWDASADTPAWFFIAPATGLAIWDLDTEAQYRWSGSAWAASGGGLSDADSDGLLYGRKDGDWFAPGVATESGTSRNIPLTDGFNRILCTSGSPVTALMRVEATVAFTVGTWMEFIQGGGGAVTFDGDTGVTVNGVSGGSVATVSAGDRIWAVKTGSDTWWATVNGAAASSENTLLLVACSDQTNALVAATGVVTFRAPKALTLSSVRASLKTASTSGAVTVDINVAGSTILSTKLTIDQDEKTSTTAATAAVISSASISDDAEITIDIDGAGTGAVGLVVAFIWA